MPFFLSFMILLPYFSKAMAFVGTTPQHVCSNYVNSNMIEVFDVLSQNGVNVPNLVSNMEQVLNLKIETFAKLQVVMHLAHSDEAINMSLADFKLGLDQLGYHYPELLSNFKFNGKNLDKYVQLMGGLSLIAGFLFFGPTRHFVTYFLPNCKTYLADPVAPKFQNLVSLLGVLFLLFGTWNVVHPMSVMAIDGENELTQLTRIFDNIHKRLDTESQLVHCLKLQYIKPH